MRSDSDDDRKARADRGSPDEDWDLIHRVGTGDQAAQFPSLFFVRFSTQIAVIPGLEKYPGAHLFLLSI